MTDYNVEHSDGVKRGSRLPNATKYDQRMTNNNNNNNESCAFTPRDAPTNINRDKIIINHAPTMTTPDPATVASFAAALLTKADASSWTTTCDDNDENNGCSVSCVRQQQHGRRWRPDDANLAAQSSCTLEHISLPHRAKLSCSTKLSSHLGSFVISWLYADGSPNSLTRVPKRDSRHAHARLNEAQYVSLTSN